MHLYETIAYAVTHLRVTIAPNFGRRPRCPKKLQNMQNHKAYYKEVSK